MSKKQGKQTTKKQSRAEQMLRDPDTYFREAQERRVKEVRDELRLSRRRWKTAH